MAQRGCIRGAPWLSKKSTISRSAAMTSEGDQLETAVAHHRSGRLTEAEALYRRVLADYPDHPDALHLLGVVLQQTGDPTGAEALIRKAISLAPDMPLFHHNLGKALAEQRRWHDAIASYCRAIELAPDYAEAWFNLGTTYQALDDHPAAENAYRRMLQIAPNDGRAYNNLGLVLEATQRLAEAADCFNRAIAAAPSDSAAHANLGRAFGKLGLIDDAVRSLRKAVELDPRDASLRDQLIFHLVAQPDATNRDIAAELQAYARGLGGVSSAGFANDLDPNRRLRVAYLSSGLQAGHNLLYLMEPLLRNHDRRRFEIFLYGDVPYAAAANESVRQLADEVRDTTGLDDSALAARIREDRIDILVSLLGRGSRVPRHPVLFHRPAPVQMALFWISPTGIPAVDYWIGDHASVPIDTTEEFREMVLRIPHLFLFQPPPDSPPVSLLPARRNGFVTFGCFTVTFKLNDKVLAAWAALLNELSEARLLLKAPALLDEQTRSFMIRRLERAGVPVARVTLLSPTSTLAEHLACYHDIDIALDTFPYTYGNTALESLWMGVPVVSLVGSRFASRITHSILHAAGFMETAAATPAAYVRTAVALAGDLDTLEDWRAAARSHISRSPLTDGAQYTAALEKEYANAWIAWRQRSSA
jgi:protein O-GlcNAc transferase